MFLSGLLDAGIGVYGAGNHGVDKDDHSLCPDADGGERAVKALKNWFSRRGALPLTAIVLALAVWLVLGAVHFGSDAAARAQGRLGRGDDGPWPTGSWWALCRARTAR